MLKTEELDLSPLHLFCSLIDFILEGVREIAGPHMSWGKPKKAISKSHASLETENNQTKAVFRPLKWLGPTLIDWLILIILMRTPNAIDCAEMKGSAHQISILAANSMVMYILCEWKHLSPFCHPHIHKRSNSCILNHHRSCGDTRPLLEQTRKAWN